MNAMSNLERFLRTDPRDGGCAETMDLLDVYVELLLSGGDPAQLYPRVAAHLRNCHPCADDLDGLLAAASA